MTIEFDRLVGTFRGLAVGDALGAPVEFQPKGSFPWVSSYMPTEKFDLAAGQYTDDTIMALALTEALIQARGYDSYQVMDEYCAWYKYGKYTPKGYCFDIGIQTTTSLADYMAAPEVRAAQPRTESAGNGVLMRFAPVAILIRANKMGEAAGDRLAALSARETHNSYQAVEATVIFNRLLQTIYTGAKKECLLYNLGTVQDTFGLIPLLQKWPEETSHSVSGSGFVRESLRAAWWAFMSTDSYREAVEAAVNLGDDADTTAAITGQLAGAYYGDKGIPAELKEGLWQTEQFETLTRSLLYVPARILKSRWRDEPEFAKSGLTVD